MKKERVVKIKNVAFSGVVMSVVAGAAVAAPGQLVKVATQSYVDETERVIEQKVENKYVKKEVLGDMGLQPGETVATKVLGVESRIETAEGGVKELRKEIETIQGGVGAVGSQIDAKISELNVGEIKSDGMAIVSVSETAGKINAEFGEIGTVGIADGAVTAEKLAFDVATQAELETVSQAAADAAAAADANLESVLELQDLLTVDGQLTSLGAAMNGISEKLANDFQVKLTGDSYIKIDSAGQIETNADTEITELSEGLATSYAVQKYAVPKPSAECANGKKPCVLAINANGEMEWMNVAFPSNSKTE